MDFTDYQYEYGQGENGVRPTSANPTSGQWSFGERFQPGMTQVLFDGVEVPYVPVRDRIKKFYRNGTDITHSISISNGSEKGGFNLSLSNLGSKGITPNNEFNRKTVNFGANYDLSDKLSIESHINYSYEKNINPPNVGQQDNTISVALYNMANSMPLCTVGLETVPIPISHFLSSSMKLEEIEYLETFWRGMRLPHGLLVRFG